MASSGRQCCIASISIMQVLAVLLSPPSTLAQVSSSVSAPRSIQSISVCSPTTPPNRGSCPAGFDTEQIVLSPFALYGSINNFADGAISDEHSSIFPPGSLNGNTNYLFFVASGTAQNRDMGVVVLSGGTGPVSNGQWIMNFANGYGYYPGLGFGAVFLEPTQQKHCPTPLNNKLKNQDPTFDLDYAAAGSVVLDPTGSPGTLVMIYEGTNDCIANPGGPSNGSGGVYITTGAATSQDYGMSWPRYNSNANFNAALLPYNTPHPRSKPIQGPDAPNGALYPEACVGNDCSIVPTIAAYGRYPVLSQPPSLAAIMQTGQPLGGGGLIADSEPSAFVDDIAPGPTTYLYAVHSSIPLTGPQFLTISQAPLNGGSAQLSFSKWDGTHFSQTGVGRPEYPIFPSVLTSSGPQTACEGNNQIMHAGSISYVEDTQQYLLVFVCVSRGDPNGSDTRVGASWFYSTSPNLSDANLWSTPQEIIGSWTSFYDSCPGFPSGPGPGNCTGAFFKGWYPTLMSLARNPGHLTTNGYVFYLWGSQGSSNVSRQYSSRAFTITTN